MGKSKLPKNRNGFQYTLVTKHEAAQLLSISPETLKKYRLQKKLIEGIHYYVWNCRTIRYNAELIKDWGINRTDPASHQVAINKYLDSL